MVSPLFAACFLLLAKTDALLHIFVKVRVVGSATILLQRGTTWLREGLDELLHG